MPISAPTSMASPSRGSLNTRCAQPSFFSGFGMTAYARLCGWTLARAHARSGDRIALAAYLGGSDRFDQAIADFAETYADQNELDYAALQAAVKDGKAEAITEI
jgi:hypothetical protein